MQHCCLLVDANLPGGGGGGGGGNDQSEVPLRSGQNFCVGSSDVSSRGNQSGYAITGDL